MSQVQACQRRVAELQGSLAVLAERCGSLEQVHEGAMERLRTFSAKANSTAAKASSKTSPLTPEQLKKQSTAKVRGLQHRHGELMKSLQEILAEVHSESSWDGLKKDHQDSNGSGMEVQAPPVPSLGTAGPSTPPVTLWRPESSKVKVLSMDGPAAKLNSRLRFHDIQAKSPPDTTFLCQNGDESNPPGRSYTPVKVPGISYPGSRNFPGAEAFPDPSRPDSREHPRISRDSNRVEEIRRRAAEIESQRVAAPPVVTPVALPMAMENPLRQVPIGSAAAPEGVDFFTNFGVDTSKSPINDVWARFQQGLPEEVRLDGLPGVQSNPSDGDLAQEPLAVPPPLVQLQPPPFTMPPPLTIPPVPGPTLGFQTAPVPMGGMCQPATPWGGGAAFPLGPAPRMNLPTMMR